MKIKKNMTELGRQNQTHQSCSVSQLKRLLNNGILNYLKSIFPIEATYYAL